MSQPIPTDSPPRYEEVPGLEHTEAERDGESRGFLRDSLSMDLDEEGSQDERAQLQREMETFEVYDPASANRPSVYSRASVASQRIARSLNEKLISPVQRMLIDPVAAFWNGANQKFDEVLGRFGNPLMFRRLIYLLVVAIVVFAAISSGIVTSVDDNGIFTGQFHDHNELKKVISEHINPDVLRDRLEYMSSMSHMAGTAGDLTLARYIEKQLMAYGLRPTELNEQQAYLTYPNSTESTMELRLRQKDKEDVVFDLWESRVYDSPKDYQKPTRPYHALSVGGDVEGHVVYANFGTKEDFQYLKDNKIDVKNSIVLMKYGKMTPGLKIKLAEEHGAVGVVMFSEKHDENVKSWPEGPDFPEGAVQRGDVGIPALTPGDILTPGWPSTSSSRTLDFSMVKNVPKIPSMPISWENAKVFLDAIKGHGKKKDDWDNNGQPDVMEWWTGDKDSPKAFLKSHPAVAKRHPIWNVLGKIEGVEQTEKAVIIGAQRDSYCYGAVEPMTGTTILLEVARVMGELNRQYGWDPLRTIYFASWDGTEQNLAGSTEWVEYNADELRREGLIYINLDAAISGSNLRVSGHPSVDGVIKKVLDEVSDPGSNKTLGDVWGTRHITSFQRSGNFLPFISHAGIVSIDLAFEGLDYPQHSCFDSFEWINKFGDPGFVYHKALADIVARLVLKYSDEPLIDFNLEGYANLMLHYVDDLERYAKSIHGWKDGKLNFDPLKSAAKTLKSNNEKYRSWLRDWMSIALDGEPPILTVHRLSWNSRLTNIDKHSLDRNGVPDRNWFKHVLFGPQLWHPTSGNHDWYTFPAIRDAIEDADWQQAQGLIKRVSALLSFAFEKFVS
ncbi:hypothetical protein TRICI_006051 [Trichomonascus ciferrii]|uniref:Transferrin receptor-like dimerisation domain-containing protein n=1 Tax=Trichomonascus ciferrii TaxID=44093 RepID=A0A642UM94_9ASCO|nr:hypothetical protein TRICI_006051 [Trichomonascus ciferrii]